MKKQLALNYLMAQPWALDQNTLGVIGDIAARDDVSLEGFDLSPITAVSAKSGKPSSSIMEMREGGVAVINVKGVISRYASMFDDICGGISTEALAKNFNAALNNPSVSGIAMNFDSPGGDANGIHEVAEMIYNARGKKPVIGYVGGTGASAIYWIASACGELVIDATAMLGSVGVVMTLERTKPDENSKRERLEIVSSQSPNKRLDGFSEEGKKANQHIVDQLGDVFVQRVARNMGVSTNHVLEHFGKGGSLVGQEAINNKMAHRLGSLESVISELKNNKGKNSMSGNTTASEESTEFNLVLPSAEQVSASALLEALTENRPDVIEAINPPQKMALDAVSKVVNMCNEADMPAMATSLLVSGVPLATAKARIEQAKELKNTLSASGLPDSFNSLLAKIDDPAKLVGAAIHEARAESDETTETPLSLTESGVANPTLNARKIYQKRKGV
ncbi:S49 family peptidase [Pseudoalteromonas umbrosa]|uniref:S49 family peptidase n=1 Tax=Pseudoalteromonas umbrosa TaxID=3048489 RepID=UPI0024C4345D|nr:S49 family peptidase [Pseudoalteromonas sp. B95]MDK1289787.1 S49 family peptidase [Pseudoalteromonas sp. B95]